MSKSTAFIIAALAFCLGLFVGLLVMSSEIENFKKGKKQAEAALKDVTKKAKIALEQEVKKAEFAKKWATQKELSLKTELNKTNYRKNEPVREIAGLKENSKNEKLSEDPIENKWIPGGFSYDNVSFRPADFPSFFSAKVLGEITNKSGKNYSISCFQISLYDKQNQLIEVCTVRIDPFLSGETKSFVGDLHSNHHLIKKYRIAFDGGFLQDE